MKIIRQAYIYWRNRDVRNRSLLLAIAFLSFCVSAKTAEIGETRADILAHHGPPPTADNSKGIAIYWWDLWKLEIQFVDDVAQKLTYTKTDPLSEAEIVGILVANGGANAWRPLLKGVWMRSDGASATLDKSTQRTVCLQGGHKHKPPTLVQDSVARVLAAPAMPSATPPPAASPLATPPSLVTFQTRNTFPAHPTFAPILFNTQGLNRPHPLTSLLPLLVMGALAFAVSRWSAHLKKSGKHPTGAAFAPFLASGTPPGDPSPESVTWDQFELVIAEIYRRQGYAVEVSSGLGADGGIDVTISRDGAITLVQCKQRRSESVGVKPVRELFGVLVSEHAARAVIVTTSEYTRDAREFAEGKPLDLLTRSDVLDLVKSVERPGENLWDVDQWITDFVANVRITDPDCPRCRKPMALRQPADGTMFWGCPDFPRCRVKRDARVEILKAQSYQNPARLSAFSNR